MRTKRTFENFEKAVANESKRYRALIHCNGKFNTEMMREFYKRKLTAIQACNAMVEVA